MEKFKIAIGSVNVRAIMTRQHQPKPMACARIVAQSFFGYKSGMKTIASHAGVFYV